MGVKNHVKILILLLIVLILITGTSSADVIYPGEKNIPFSYQITNIQDYPDYVFILHGTPNPSMEILNSSEFSFYKLSVCSIYAMPKIVANEAQLDQMDEEQINHFLNNDSRVARSNLELNGIYGSVPVSDSLESALITLKINSIQGNNLDIQKDKIIYTYTSGESVEQFFSNQNETPQPKAPGISWEYYIYFIVLPILAIILIMFIILRRRTN